MVYKRNMDFLSDDVLLDVIGHLPFARRTQLIYVNKQFARIIGMWKKLRIASFDIGRKNFAHYVEDCDLNDLKDLKTLDRAFPYKKVRDKWLKSSATMEILMNALMMNGTRVDIGVFNFQTGDAAKSTKLDNPTLLNFFNHMERYRPLWDTCDIFVIEQQFVALHGRYRGINMDAIKLGAITHAWLLEQYPNREVVSFGSTNKTQMLGASSRMNKAARKKWATAKALSIFEQRNDTEALRMYQLSLDIKGKRLNTEEKIQSYFVSFEDCAKDIRKMAEYMLRTRQKMDDISDTVVQLQAYKYMRFVNT